MPENRSKTQSSTFEKNSTSRVMSRCGFWYGLTKDLSQATCRSFLVTAGQKNVLEIPLSLQCSRTRRLLISSKKPTVINSVLLTNLIEGLRFTLVFTLQIQVTYKNQITPYIFLSKVQLSKIAKTYQVSPSTA